jgi:hypothetical protein
MKWLMPPSAYTHEMLVYMARLPGHAAPLAKQPVLQALIAASS